MKRFIFFVATLCVCMSTAASETIAYVPPHFKGQIKIEDWAQLNAHLVNLLPEVPKSPDQHDSKSCHKLTAEQQQKEKHRRTFICREIMTNSFIGDELF